MRQATAYLINSVSFLADKLARFCLLLGKTLPPHWQNFAIGLAKVYQKHGNRLAKLLSD